MRSPALLLPLALGLSCAAPTSDSGRLSLEPHGKVFALTADTFLGWSGEAPLLEGARLCPRFRCRLGCDADGGDLFPEVTDCFTVDASGPLSEDDGCFRVSGAGAVELALTPRECEAPVVEPFDVDAFSALSAVSFASVRAQPWLGVERILVDPAAAEHTLPLADVPEAFLDGEDRYHALAGRPVRLPVEVVRRDQTPVAYDPGGRLDLDPPPLERVAEEDAELQPLVVLEAGRVYALTAEVHGLPLAAGEAVGVDPATLAHIEIVPFLLGTSDEEGRAAGPEGAPRALDVRVHDALDHFLAARALVFDDAGRVVHGVPVEWALSSGAAVVQPLAALSERYPARALNELEVASDLISLSDRCRPPEDLEGPLALELIARFAGLEARQAITLVIGPPAAEPNLREAWTPDPNCQGPDIASARGGRIPPVEVAPPRVNPEGCGCASSRPSGSVGFSMAFTALFFALRRRS